MEEVTFLEMQIDTTQQAIDHIGPMLPNLQQLKLNNSTIETFRDFGTKLKVSGHVEACQGRI